MKIEIYSLQPLALEIIKETLKSDGMKFVGEVISGDEGSLTITSPSAMGDHPGTVFPWLHRTSEILQKALEITGETFDQIVSTKIP